MKKITILTLCVAVLAAAIWFSAAAFLSWRDHRTYPLTYMETLAPYAERYALDPYLVLAVIKVESGFRPEVISSAGAVGLMQIMPDTGRWISEKLGEEGYEDAWLKKPETNIAYGCWYLSYLTGRFDAHFDKVFAAYNAGGGNVDLWCRDPEIAPDGINLDVEKIPFSQTRNYIFKVRKAYAEYQRIYPPQNHAG